MLAAHAPKPGGLAPLVYPLRLLTVLLPLAVLLASGALASARH